MTIRTERVEFRDGVWWEIMAELPYGVFRRIQGISASLVGVDGAEAVGDAIKRVGPERMAEVADKLNSERLLSCSVAWSWEGPITAEAIDALPSSVVRKVLDRMNALYSFQDDREQGALKKA